MVEIDRSDLSAALSEGFPQDTAEKVVRLLGLLHEIQDLEETRGKFTLKGGTALNIFHWAEVPRLSVDIDLMATEFPTARAGTPGHRKVIDLVAGVGERLGYRVSRRESPAACTLILPYVNTLGTSDQIKVDLDILNRMTILPSQEHPGPHLFLADKLSFPVVEAAELLGQKLTAVVYRHAVRDLYDMHRMLLAGWHQLPRARECYLVYSFLTDHEWPKLSYPAVLDVDYEPRDLDDVLRRKDSAPPLESIRAAAKGALEGTSPPYTAATTTEESARKRLLEGDLAAFADIAGEYDPTRRAALAKHPALAWRLRQAAQPGGHKRSK